MSPPRVAFVTNIVPPYRKSFYEKLCATPGFEWLVLHGSTGAGDGRPAFRGPLAIPARALRNRELRLGPFTLRWQSGALAAVRAFRPRVLVVLGIPGTLSNWLLCAWSRAAGVRVIAWASGFEAQREGSAAWRLKHLLARRYFSLADRCLVYGSRGAAELERLGVPRSRIRICWNGIEIDPLLAAEPAIRAEADSLRRREGAERARVILYVGGMLGDKRVDLLLRAYGRIRRDTAGCVLWLVGDGPARPALEALARELALPDVRFFGRIEEGADAFFAAADLCVLPGLGGLALAQALFWGTPCVVGEADGTEEDLVPDGATGRRFVPGDLDSLAAAMRACLEATAEERARWGERGRALVTTRSNVSEMVRTFVAGISELSPRAPAPCAGRVGEIGSLDEQRTKESAARAPRDPGR
jgi:glycosyltransferase involved in cell wall biosynthesis